MRYEITLSFEADDDSEAQQVITDLTKRNEGGDHDVNVREFTLKTVEYL